MWYVRGAVYARASALKLHMTLAIIVLLHLYLAFLCYCLSDKVFINRAPVIIPLCLSSMCFCDEMEGNVLFARHWGIDSQSPILHIGKLVRQRPHRSICT